MPVSVSAAGALCSLRASRWKCGPCFSCQGCAVAVDVRSMHSSLTAASSRERGGRTCRGGWRGRTVIVPEHPKHNVRTQVPGVNTRTSADKYQQQFHGQQQQFQRATTTVFRMQSPQMEAILAQRRAFGRHVAISHTEGTTLLCHPRTPNCGEWNRPKYCVHWLFI